MKKISVSLVIFLIGLPAFIFAGTYWGGELPNIGNTKLKSEVALTDSVYKYTYVISSDTMNTGQIWSFDIDVKKPENSIDLSSEGIVNGPGYLKHTSAQVLSEPTTPKMIPVGLFSPPNWNSGPDIVGRVGWGANDDQYMIAPGKSLTGFQIMSRGLPGLRDSIIEPDLIPPSEESGITLEQIKAVKNQVAFKNKTIGPTAPPASFVALDFVNYIIDLKHQAGTLGWITNPGVQDSLDVKLDQVKKKLEAGDTKTASNILAAFINEVDAQGCQNYNNCLSGKHLLPEAWALLRYNAQFLLGKL